MAETINGYKEYASKQYVDEMLGDVDLSGIESDISALESIVNNNKAKLDKIELGASITWDGKILPELESYVVDDTITIYKVSDRFISAEDMIGQTLSMTEIDYNQVLKNTIQENVVSTTNEPNGTTRVTAYNSFVISLDSYSFEMGLSAGTYFGRMSDVYISELSLPANCISVESGGTGANDPQGAREVLDVYSKTEVDEKVFGAKKTITWDGNISGLQSFNNNFYKVSDIVLSADELLGQTITVDNDNDISFIEITQNNIDYESGWLCAGDFPIAVVFDSSVAPTGIYFYRLGERTYVAELTLPKTDGHTHPSIESAISKLEESIVPADWKVNDPNDPAYIANRPFYTGDSVETTIFSETTVNIDSGGWADQSYAFEFVEGNEYKVIWDNVTYNAIAVNENGFVYIGNGNLLDSELEDFIENANYPFAMSNYYGMLKASASGTHTFSISVIAPEIHKIDQKYLTLPDGAYVGAHGNADGSEIFNDIDNDASGIYSHAEGVNTIASGDMSHAEGWGATASGQTSHAEGGNTTASGESGSHAEGWYTTASGQSAHAEGNSTHATGDYSHAEGVSTIASGDMSHAEGRYTKASSPNQHVQGKFNIIDEDSVYAHIVGNGTGDSNAYRSNAHTLDWDGNAWYKGTIKVGGTSYADASEVATRTETWTFTLEDGSTVTKAVYVG